MSFFVNISGKVTASDKNAYYDIITAESIAEACKSGKAVHSLQGR